MSMWLLIAKKRRELIALEALAYHTAKQIVAMRTLKTSTDKTTRAFNDLSALLEELKEKKLIQCPSGPER